MSIKNVVAENTIVFLMNKEDKKLKEDFLKIVLQLKERKTSALEIERRINKTKGFIGTLKSTGKGRVTKELIDKLKDAYPEIDDRPKDPIKDETTQKVISNLAIGQERERMEKERLIKENNEIREMIEKEKLINKELLEEIERLKGQIKK